jgi:hypothetical protein
MSTYLTAEQYHFVQGSPRHLSHDYNTRSQRRDALRAIIRDCKRVRNVEVMMNSIHLDWLVKRDTDSIERQLSCV